MRVRKRKTKTLRLSYYKKLRSMHSSERIEEMVCELEGYRWDALLISETWRQDKSEIWETHHKHKFMAAKKIRQQTRCWNYAEQEVVAKNYRHQVHQRTGRHCHNRGKPPTHQTDERVLHHSGYADHHVEKMFEAIEKHPTNCKKYIPIFGGDFNAELGPSHGTECISVGRHTLNEGNIRSDWMKHLADITRTYSTQHDVQKNTSETNDLQISKR